MNAVAIFFLHLGQFVVECILTFLKAGIGLFLLAAICHALNQHPFIFGGLFVGGIFFWRWYL